jgi:hypothetical protein
VRKALKLKALEYVGGFLVVFQIQKKLQNFQRARPGAGGLVIDPVKGLRPIARGGIIALA